MRRAMSRVSAAAMAVITAGAATTAPAWAGLTICNETPNSRSVAIGYKEADNWVSEGWWNVAPGECATVVGGNLKSRYYYYRANSSSASFDGEGYMFCTQAEPFTIIGDENCNRRGYRSESFREIDTGPDALDFTLTMTDGSASQGRSSSGGGGAAPGRYGEPFTVTGTSMGCDRIDGLLSCEVMVDGWRYVAMDDGRTPEPLLQRLDAQPMNQRVEIEGDMIVQGDVSVDVVLRDVRVLEGTGGASDPTTTGLIGLWASLDDPASTIRFTRDGEHISYYQGDMVERDTFYVGSLCPEGQPPGDLPVLVVTSSVDGMPLCYTVERLTDSNLTLMYLSRGNFLEYRRAGY